MPPKTPVPRELLRAWRAGEQPAVEGASAEESAAARAMAASLAPAECQAAAALPFPLAAAVVEAAVEAKRADVVAQLAAHSRQRGRPYRWCRRLCYNSRRCQR